MIVHRVEHNRRRLRLLVHVCQTRGERARGLLLRRRPDGHTAYLLAPCSAVHTFGMTYPIDVLFCDPQGWVLEIVEHVKPWRMVRNGLAGSVWELRAGAASSLGIKPGDRISPC